MPGIELVLERGFAMIKNFYNSPRRRWIAVLLSALFALGIIVWPGIGRLTPGAANAQPLELFLRVEQPHLGQDRWGESSLINVNAPTMYANASSQTIGYTYRPGSLTPIGEL